MTTYNAIYCGLQSLLSRARDDLARYPLVKIENRVTRKIEVSVFAPAVSDCVDNLDLCAMDDPERQAYSDSDGAINDELVATALRDGDSIDAGDLTYRRVDVQELADWLDAHDGDDDTPADLWSDLPSHDLWRQVARLSEPVRDFIEYLDELANL